MLIHRSSINNKDLHQEIQKEGSKYIRHTLRNVQAFQTQQQQQQQQQPQTSNGGTTSPVPTKEKDAHLPSKIQASYAEIDKLALEKLELAQRIVELITRARARLDHDLGKVLALQGEVLDGGLGLGLGLGMGLGLGLGNGLGGGVGGSFTLGGRNPVNQINESLRNAFAGSTGLGVLGAGDVLALSPVGQGASAVAPAGVDTHRNKSEPLFLATLYCY